MQSKSNTPMDKLFQSAFHALGDIPALYDILAHTNQ